MRAFVRQVLRHEPGGTTGVLEERRTLGADDAGGTTILALSGQRSAATTASATTDLTPTTALAARLEQIAAPNQQRWLDRHGRHPARRPEPARKFLQHRFRLAWFL